MNRVELSAMLGKEFQRIALVELERVSRLGRNVHAHHVEPGAMVANGTTA